MGGLIFTFSWPKGSTRPSSLLSVTPLQQTLQILNPLTTVQAHILARTLLATPRQAIELESYPNHPRIQQVFGSTQIKRLFVFGGGFLEVTSQ